MDDDTPGPPHSSPPAQASPAVPTHETTLRYWFRCPGLSKTALAKAVTTLAIQRGHPRHARACVALALYGARDTASPVLRAGLRALDARFAALLNDEREILRAVHNSREIFADGSDQDTPSYATYLDYPELASTLGEVLLFPACKTGNQTHASTAISLLSEASQGRAEPRVRSRVFDAIGLARAQLTVGELDAACHNGLHALQIGTSLTSTRVRKRYHDLARETQAHTDTRLANLRERLLITATHPRGTAHELRGTRESPCRLYGPAGQL